MKSFVLIITPVLGREEWRKRSKNLIAIPAGKEYDHIDWWPQIMQMALGEFVKNICDHAGSNGAIIFRIYTNMVTLNVYDFGPGYTGASPDTSSLEAIGSFHQANGSSIKQSWPGGPAGQGVHHIDSLLSALSKKPKVKGSFIKITTKGRFRYHCAWWW